MVAEVRLGQGGGPTRISLRAYADAARTQETARTEGLARRSGGSRGGVEEREMNGQPAKTWGLDYLPTLGGVFYSPGFKRLFKQ